MKVFLRKAKIRADIGYKVLTRGLFPRYFYPFNSESSRPIIIHCCYHKVGTVWFSRILREVAAEIGFSYGVGSNYSKISRLEQQGNFDIFLDYGSHVNLEFLPDYIGSHMIRDPRDLIISGYFYHRWTNETWANLPLAEHRGMSYKEYLNSLSQNQGIAVEIKRSSFWINHMANWNFKNPKIYEIKYEDLIEDEKSIFRKLFEHYGFKKDVVEKCCKIADKYSFKNFSGNNKKQNSHLRSGRSGEWKLYFTEEHKRLFKEMYPGALTKLGYESDNDW